MIKTFLPFMLYWFSNDLFALKKCRILNIENLTSNKKIGYQAFIVKKSSDKLIVAYIFKI